MTEAAVDELFDTTNVSVSLVHFWNSERSAAVGSTSRNRTSRPRKRSARSSPGCLSMSLPRYNASFLQSGVVFCRQGELRRSGEPFWRNEDGIVARPA